MKGNISDMYKRIWKSKNLQKIDSFSNVADNTTLREVILPKPTDPSMMLVGAWLQGSNYYVASAAEDADGTALASALSRIELKETTTQLGTIFTSAQGVEEINRYLFCHDVIQDALVNFAEAGNLTKKWNIFVPLSSNDIESLKVRTGDVTDAYAADVVALTSFTVYAVFAPRNLVIRRNVFRQTNIQSMTVGNITPNLAALDNLPMPALLFLGDDSSFLTTFNYVDQGITIDLDVQTINADNDLLLEAETQSTGVYWINLYGRTYAVDRGILIQPTFSTATAPDVITIQELDQRETEGDKPLAAQQAPITRSYRSPKSPYPAGYQQMQQVYQQ